MLQWNCIQNKISPNNGILFNGVLRPKVLTIPFTSYFLINFDFLLPHIAHFDNSTVLPLLLFITFGFMFSLFFYTLKNKMALFYICNFKLLLIISLRLITSSMPNFLPSSIRLLFSVSLL